MIEAIIHYIDICFYMFDFLRKKEFCFPTRKAYVKIFAQA